MGTLLRVDPAGGCFTFPTSTTLVGGALKSGSVTALAVDDSTYYQVNPKTTTRTIGDDRRAGDDHRCLGYGLPGLGQLLRPDRQRGACRSPAGQGTTTWTVSRGQLGTAAATHANGATISALANDWYAAFSGVVSGSKNLKVTYKGKNCATTTLTTCSVDRGHPAAADREDLQLDDRRCGGLRNGDRRAGWVTLPLTGPAQPQAVGSTDVSSTWTLPGSAAAYLGTGSYAGQVRVLVHTQRWTAPSPTPFSTWGNFMKTRLRRAVRRLRQKERLMRAFANKKMLGLLALVAAAAGFAVYTTASHAAAVPVSLCAKTGSVTMPDCDDRRHVGIRPRRLHDRHCRGRRSGARGQRRRRGHDQPHEQPAGRPHGLVRALGAAGRRTSVAASTSSLPLEPGRSSTRAPAMLGGRRRWGCTEP